MGKLRDMALGLLALFFLGSMVWWLARDVIRSGEGDAAAPEADPLAQVVPEQGWLPALEDPIFSWEKDLQGWQLESESPQALAAVAPDYLPRQGEAPAPDAVPAPKVASEVLEVSTERAKAGSHSLRVPVRFPDPATIYISWGTIAAEAGGLPVKPTTDNIPSGLIGVRYIAYDVYLPEDAKGYVSCLLFLKDKDGMWFQARARTRLKPGRWTTVTADIRGGSPDVTPLGHTGQWDENQASQIRAVGVTLYGERDWTGSVWIDNFRGWMRPDRFERLVDRPRRGLPEERREELAKLMPRAADVKDEPLAILNLRTEPAMDPDESDAVPRIARFERFTLRFDLNRSIGNPFDPEQADVRATVKTPSGAVFEATGFWYQDFERRARFEGDELVPLGRPEWRVRVTPRETGRYEVTLKVKIAGEPAVSAAPVAFDAAPGPSRGFVRVSETDKHFFECEDGSFFYPVGHNVHSPVDLRCWEQIFREDPPLDRGLRMYESFFPKMAGAGQNVAEVWMASWWLGIEWTKYWRTYAGAGRYSLQHAWLLDKVLDLARAHGIRVHLVIDNHGKFSEWCDWEWELNPYYSRNPGGSGLPGVEHPSDFFANEAARQLHKQRLRYIAARWAPDPAILGWELVSEMDLVGDGAPGRNGQIGRGNRNWFRTDSVPQAWVREMLAALKDYDVYDHPATNHYATDHSWVDKKLAAEPVMDYIVCDAYRAQPGYLDMVRHTEQALGRYDKPFWVTEYGGNWDATTVPRLEADLHTGLWGTWMSDAAATPLFWWYDFIDHRDLYSQYRAFAKYIEGEDRRGLNGRLEFVTVQSGTGRLKGTMYRWKDGAYAWIYDEQSMQQMPEPDARPRYADEKAYIYGLAPGRYRVEYWDTFTGKKLETAFGRMSAGRPLELLLPPFECDIALKVKATDDSPPETDGTLPKTRGVQPPSTGTQEAPEQPAVAPPLPK